MLEGRLVGILEAEQKGKYQEKKRNDRLIAVAEQSLLYAGIHHLRDLNQTVLKQIEAFFVNYQKSSECYPASSQLNATRAAPQPHDSTLTPAKHGI